MDPTVPDVLVECELAVIYCRYVRTIAHIGTSLEAGL